MRKRNHLRYYWDKVLSGFSAIILRTLTALSFLLMPFYFGYIVYFSILCYDLSKVIAGCISLYIMIHLNKSL